MLNFPIQTNESAPEGSRANIAAVEKAWGFAPNLIRTFANSPAVLEGAWGLLTAFGKTRFSPAEQQLIALAISVENECSYCAAAHSLMGKGAGLKDAELAAARAGHAVMDAKHEALRRFATVMTATRGNPTAQDIEAFLTAGYDQTHILEVILGVATKTLMNYTDHVAHVKLDDAFNGTAWTAELKKAA
jgi:uncharacterized peroxidase-related enzyme